MLKTKDILRQVRHIEIVTKRLVDGLIAGNYHSIFRGQGIEFSEIREYRPGDDVRTIDWKVTARFNTPYIKEFIEERDLHVYFAFDFSASGCFGNLVEKRQKAIELTAALMFSALRNNDNVGTFIFTDRIEHYVPARKGRRHLLKTLSTLLSFDPESKRTDLEASLAFIAKVIKKRSIIFVVSDFQSEDFTKPLSILRNRHDLIAIRVFDRREREIPDIGLIHLEDEETGEQLLLDTSDRGFRENYSRLMKERDDRLKEVFKRQKIDSVDVTTDGDYQLQLKRFFKTRKRRLKA